MDIHILESNRRTLKALSSALISLALFLSFDSRALAADSYAIFSLNSEFSELSTTKARKLYRGKTKRLQGQRIELSDWPDTSSERSEFYRYLLNKNVAQMNAHWASLSFSGKARPPKVIDSSDMETLIDWMKEKPNRIGYAPVSSLPSNAQILYVVSSEK
jgi:ABC-type phosphate transport system substrate-binding protein